MHQPSSFAMFHPAYALPGLWNIARGRPPRIARVRDPEDARVIATGAVGDTTYSFRGPRPLTDRDLSYMLALAANAARKGSLRVLLGSGTRADEFISTRLPRHFDSQWLYGVETHLPRLSRNERLEETPRTCRLEQILRDADKEPDEAERTTFFKFIRDVASATTIQINGTRDGLPYEVGGIPLLMYQIVGRNLHIWHEPVLSGVLGGIATPFHTISLLERNRLKRNSSRMLHFRLTTTISAGETYGKRGVRRETLLNLLYPTPAPHRQELSRRSKVLDGALIDLADIGWRVREKSKLLLVTRPRATKTAAEPADEYVTSPPTNMCVLPTTI